MSAAPMFADLRLDTLGAYLRALVSGLRKDRGEVP